MDSCGNLFCDVVDIFIRDKNVTQRAVFSAVQTDAFSEDIEEGTAVRRSPSRFIQYHTVHRLCIGESHQESSTVSTAL